MGMKNLRAVFAHPVRGVHSGPRAPIGLPSPLPITVAGALALSGVEPLTEGKNPLTGVTVEPVPIVYPSNVLRVDRVPQKLVACCAHTRWCRDSFRIEHPRRILGLWGIVVKVRHVGSPVRGGGRGPSAPLTSYTFNGA